MAHLGPTHHRSEGIGRQQSGQRSFVSRWIRHRAVWPGGLVESSLQRQRVVLGGPRYISTRPGRGPCDPCLQRKPSRHRSRRRNSRGRRKHGERSCPGCYSDQSRHLSRWRLQVADQSREGGSMVVEGLGCRATTTAVLDVPWLCVVFVGAGWRQRAVVGEAPDSRLPHFVADHLHISSFSTFTINTRLLPSTHLRLSRRTFLGSTQCRSLLPDASLDQYSARYALPFQPRRRLDPPSRNHHTNLAASRSLPPHNSPQGGLSLLRPLCYMVTWTLPSPAKSARSPLSTRKAMNTPL